MAKIHRGLATNEVLSILGPPNDVRTQYDPGGIGRVHCKEIWCYGTKTHLGFPTLGCVYIDQNGRSQESSGGRGKPPAIEDFDEDELERLLRLLDTAPGLNGYSYNPLPVIRIVNTLQPLGKQKALAAMDEYLRVSDEFAGFMGARSGLMLVLRVLFDLPENIDPRNAGGFGAPEPAGPKDPHRIPRFPIALVDDIPVMLAGGYMLEGMATPMEKVVDFFRQNGQLRSKLLTPTNDPLGALSHLTASSQWIYTDPRLAEPDGISFGAAADDQREKGMVMEQLLRLIDSVYRLPTDVYGDRLPCDQPPAPAWQRTVADLAKLNIRWDSKKQLFVFKDGTHLPDSMATIYRRQIWKLDGLGYDDAELVLERQSDSWLNITVNRTESAGAKIKGATLTVVAGDKTGSPLAAFSFNEMPGGRGGSSESRTVGLAAESGVTAKLVINGAVTNWSPTFRP